MSRQSDLAELLAALGAEVENHALALEGRHIVGFSVLGEVVGKACQEEFTLLLEDDGTSAEEDIGFDFVAVLEELDGMLEFEIVVMVVGLRSETDFLDFHFLGIGLSLFLLFLLGVEEFLVVDDPADRRSGGRCDLDEVEVLVIRHAHGLFEIVDTGLYVVADKAYLQDSANFVVDTVRILFDNTTATRSGLRCCYSFILPIIQPSAMSCQPSD